MQLLSWVIAAFIFASFAVTVISLYMWERDDEIDSGTDQWIHDVACSALTAGYLISFLTMVIMTVKVTKSDPTDPTVALERLARIAQDNNMASIDFDAADYEFYCEVCNTHVLKNTKHCQRCNRCSAEFDHHCIWVSNDIGLSNYIDFMRMLTAVLFTVLFQIAFSVYTLCVLADVPDEVEIGSLGASRRNLNILTWVTVSVTVILLILDTYLLSFHVYLVCKNTSTYKHIRAKRRNSQSRVIVEVSKRDN